MTPVQRARALLLAASLPTHPRLVESGGVYALVGDGDTTVLGDSGPLRYATPEGLLTALEAMAERAKVTP